MIFVAATGVKSLLRSIKEADRMMFPCLRRLCTCVICAWNVPLEAVVMLGDFGFWRWSFNREVFGITMLFLLSVTERGGAEARGAETLAVRVVYEAPRLGRVAD